MKKKPVDIKLTADLIKPFKRLLTCLGDLLIFLIISIVAFSFAATPIIKTIPSYQGYAAQYDNGIAEQQKMYVDAALLDYKEEGVAFTSGEWRDIYIQNKIDKKDYDESGKLLDIFSCFYVDFLNGKHSDNREYSYDRDWVNQKIYRYDSQGDIVLWETPTESNQIIHLTDQAIAYLKDYMNDNRTVNSVKYYNEIKSFTENNIVKAAEILNGLDEFKAVEKNTEDGRNKLLFVNCITAIIVYTILFFIYFLLIPALMGKGQTITKKILKVALYGYDGKPIKFTNLLLRSILEWLLFSFCILLIPYFQVGTLSVIMPMMFINGAPISFSILGLIGFIGCIISFFFIYSGDCKQSLQDKTVRCVAVDPNTEMVDHGFDDRVISSPFLEDLKKEKENKPEQTQSTEQKEEEK